MGDERPENEDARGYVHWADTDTSKSLTSARKGLRPRNGELHTCVSSEGKGSSGDHVDTRLAYLKCGCVALVVYCAFVGLLFLLIWVPSPYVNVTVHSDFASYFYASIPLKYSHSILKLKSPVLLLIRMLIKLGAVLAGKEEVKVINPFQRLRLNAH